LAEKFGHTLIPPVPSAVPLIVKDRMVHGLQGQRIRVRAASRIGEATSRTAEGDLLFAAYGLSGTAVLDVSESLSVALHRGGRKDAEIEVDFLPTLPLDRLAAEFAVRRKAGWAAADWTAGLLPEKFSSVLRSFLPSGADVAAVAEETLAAALKSKRFLVTGTRGWNEAEFTAGGVDALDVEPETLESKLRRGLYLAGEILDVQGPRGGFNLAWAWASGLAAGDAAARA